MEPQAALSGLYVDEAEPPACCDAPSAESPREPLYVPRLADAVWSADFVSDALFCDRRYRTFNIVDNFNPEAMHIEVDTSITSGRLIRVFQTLRFQHVLP